MLLYKFNQALNRRREDRLAIAELAFHRTDKGYAFRALFIDGKLMTTQAAADIVCRIKRKMKLLLDIRFDRTTNIALWQVLNVAASKTDSFARADDLIFTILQQEKTHRFE